MKFRWFVLIGILTLLFIFLKSATEKDPRVWTTEELNHVLEREAQATVERYREEEERDRELKRMGHDDRVELLLGEIRSNQR